jgi:hypothetical protein
MDIEADVHCNFISNGNLINWKIRNDPEVHQYGNVSINIFSITWNIDLAFACHVFKNCLVSLENLNDIRYKNRLKPHQIHKPNFFRSFLIFLINAFLLLLFYHFYIYLNVSTLIGPPPPSHLCSGQKLFHPLFPWFCWRENIRDNKKDKAFLLVWDQGSYTERFLALFPCTSVLQPTLVHLYQTSSLLPSPLPIVASASLKLLYSLFYGEHINHIQVLGFLPFLYSSCAHSSLKCVTHDQ